MPKAPAVVGFSCEFPGCQKSYGKKHHLKEHERKHTGDMKYKCEVCEKQFKSKDSLSHHQSNAHGEVQPYKCDICENKAFRRADDLKKHKLKHEGIKGFDSKTLLKCPVFPQLLKKSFSRWAVYVIGRKFFGFEMFAVRLV